MPKPPQHPRARLYKRERLCSRLAVETLFARGAAAQPGLQSALAYPLRAVWLAGDDSMGATARTAPVPQFLISVPKRRLRKAVMRVAMRRLVREAWRRHRSLLPEEGKVAVAFVYVADKTCSYSRVERSMCSLMERIARNLSGADESGS